MAAATAAYVNGLAGGNSDAAGASPSSVAATGAATASPNGSHNSSSTNAKRKRDSSDDNDEVMADADTSAEATSTKAAAPSASASPAPSSLSAKAKVEAAPTSNGSEVTPGPTTSSTTGNRDEKRLIRDYFDVLQSFDKLVPPLLKRSLPEPVPADEPQAKRQKPDESSTPSPKPITTSIFDKVESDAYALLDDLVLDVATIIRSELAVLEAPVAKTESEAAAPAEATGDPSEKKAEETKDAEDTKETDDANTADTQGDDGIKESEREKRIAIARIAKFRELAYDLYRRETAYPRSGPLHGKADGKINGDASLSIVNSNQGQPVLTVFGNAPGPRQLFSSLPSKHLGAAASGTGNNDDEDSIEEIVREDEDFDLGGNVTLTRTFAPPALEKTSRAPTFGELFPSPRNLPPLQPPKAPKSTTKSTTLSFYHPELAEKSKYRTGSYSTQTISVGQWLDYSNATPSSQIKTRQRERAQSLAGHKPSMAELEMSEVESLFRGAFSSFAPSKDDSGAVVPATHLGRIWWQRVGHRVFQHMTQSGLYDDDDEDIDEATTPTDVTPGMTAAITTLDEEALQKTIDEWDDSLVDPSLEEVMGQKSDTDKDVDELLQDVSDLIVTLASYQRNRNLTLPTSQDRFSADPVNADMLRNGTLAQQPSEEEMLTYQTLKAQLSLIIQALPPYAVARLNSDKLDELNISTKIEVRSEEYRGILEEDEAVVRARQAAQAAQAAASAPQRTPAHRSASTSVAGPAASNHNYGAQFNTPIRTPMAAHGAGGFYPGQHQTPARATATQSHRPSMAGGVVGTPGAALPPHVRPGGQGQAQFRPSPNGYNNYQPALAKTGMQQQPQFRQGLQQPMHGYPGSSAHQAPHMSPQRTVSQPQPGVYGSPALQPGTPQQFRYPPGTPGHPQQVPLPAVPPQGVAYPGSPANGVAHLAQQQRPIQHGSASPQQRFHPSPNPMTPGGQQPPQQIMARPPPPNYAGGVGAMTPQAQAQAAAAQQQQQQRQFNAPAGGGPFGYHTVMDQPQQQRLMEQARARASAHERSLGFGDRMSQGGGNGGGMGQVAGLAGIGLGGNSGASPGMAGNNGNVDMSKLAAARANMPGMASQQQFQQQQQQQFQQQQQQRLSPMPSASGSARPSPVPGQFQVQHQPHLQPHSSSQPFIGQQQMQQHAQLGAGIGGSASPSPAAMNGNSTPQQPPMQMSTSPAPSGGFQRPY